MSSRNVTNIAVAGNRPPLQLVELNSMLFSSTIHGADPETGGLASEPQEQFEVAFRNRAIATTLASPGWPLSLMRTSAQHGRSTTIRCRMAPRYRCRSSEFGV